MAMRQAGFHMLRNPHKFYKSIEYELSETGESYESYCWNVFHSKVWGDDLVAGAFADMWNLGISIISPVFRYPIDLWHGKEDPEILLIANGGSYMADGRKTTHFSSSRKIDSAFKKPGLELVNNTIGISSELVYKKLEPTVLDDPDRARRMAIEEYTKAEKKKSLELLYTITHSIDRMDKHIGHLIRESDRKKEQKKNLEFKMSCLGISLDKIELVSKQKELPYMLTEATEKELIIQERKRKREEAENEETRKRQKREMIKMKDGEIVNPESETVTTPSEETQSGDVSQNPMLVVEQNAVIKNQEEIIQRQEAQLLSLNLRIQQLEAEKQQQAQQIQQQQQQTYQVAPQAPAPLPTMPTISSISIPTLDDDDLAQLDLTVQPMAGTSTGTVQSSTKGPFAIENLIKSEHLKYLPKYQNVVMPEDTQEGVVEVVNLPPEGSSNIVYIPKRVNEKSTLVLVPPTQKRVNTKRSNPGIPVPADIRDAKRHYCENCACNYKEKGDLNKHVRYNCRNTNADYICEECQKQFLTDYGVREHYYQEHLKEFLYFCTRCGQGFYHKSKKSIHKKKCTMMDQPEKFNPRAPVREELELTFKRRQRVEVPDEVRQIAEEEEESAKASSVIQSMTEKKEEASKKDEDDDDE